MEQFPSLETSGSVFSGANPPLSTHANITAAAVKRALEPIRFPTDSSGKTLAEMAQRDLDATLQLLVDRAIYITGSSGAAIALKDGEGMVCRAASGECAPQIGAQLHVNSGLTGECVRGRQVLRCDDAANDPRVNQESCRGLGIVSVLVAPVTQEEEVIGVFELFSGRARAFEERDTTAVQRLGEMIQTAVTQAKAAASAQENIVAAPTTQEKPVAQKIEVRTEKAVAETPSAPTAQKDAAPPRDIAEKTEDSASVGHLAHQLAVHRCQACGFPVSEGRKLCVDCQALADSGDLPASSSTTFLAEYAERQKSAGWFRSNIYWVGVALISVATVAALVWLR